MTQDQIGNYAVIIITLLLLGIGLISVLIGQAVRLWDWLINYRPTPITSSRAPVPATQKNEREQRSDAVEQGGNVSAGTRSAIVDALGNMDETELLDILARVVDEDGEYRFAESRVAKFVGGRVEDRIRQVRQARGIAESGPYETPIAGRPTAARFEQPA